MEKSLEMALNSLKTEGRRLAKKLNTKKKPRDLKDGEETGNNIKEREMAKTTRLFKELNLRAIITAIAILEAQDGICPYCKERNIDPNFVKDLYFPFCKKCAKILGDEKEDFLRKNHNKEKYQRIEEELRIAV